MAKLMEEMQKEYGDRAAFIVINIDEWNGIENDYLIEEMPAQIFYDASGEPIWQHRGPVDAETMRERVNILSTRITARQKAQRHYAFCAFVISVTKQLLRGLRERPA